MKKLIFLLYLTVTKWAKEIRKKTEKKNQRPLSISSNLTLFHTNSIIKMPVITGVKNYLKVRNIS